MEKNIFITFANGPGFQWPYYYFNTQQQHLPYFEKR